jgi:hypothetical protein
MNNEKAVFTFEKVNDTIITVVEALGGKREQDVEPQPQEEILYVPDEIRFYEWTGDITLEVSEDWFLCYDSKNQAHNFIGGIKASPIAMVMPTPIKCKLVPVKYEDIQVGDCVVPNGGVDSVTNFCMKHGDHKFCGIGAYGFLFNRDWYNEGSNLLKVVKA